MFVVAQQYPLDTSPRAWGVCIVGLNVHSIFFFQNFGAFLEHPQSTSSLTKLLVVRVSRVSLLIADE